MNSKKRPLQDIAYGLFLLVAIVALFYWYTTQNSSRVEERNKNYAADSARLTAERVDQELNNAQNLVDTYIYFIEEGLTEPMVSADMLARMEENSRFDAVLYTDFDGNDYASDGRVSDVTARDFYQEGIIGERNSSIIYDPHFFDETMLCFYAPVHYQGSVSGGRESSGDAFHHLFWRAGGRVSLRAGRKRYCQLRRQ